MDLRAHELPVGDSLDQAVTDAREAESSWGDLSDHELGEQMRELEQDALQTPASRAVVVRVAGLGAESFRRQFGFRLRDAQVKGAIAAARGAIIEMQAGEGKTVACGLAAIIRTILGPSVHVAPTPNTSRNVITKSWHPLSNDLESHLGCCCQRVPPVRFNRPTGHRLPTAGNNNSVLITCETNCRY